MKLFIFIFLACNLTFGQSVVVDSINKKPIQFALIKYFNEHLEIYRDYSNEEGHFKTKIEKKITCFSISCLGYEFKRVDNINADTIFLRPIDFQIEPVVITNQDETVLGYSRSKSKLEMGIDINLEEVVFIENKSKIERLISGFELKIAKRKKIDAIPFRISIYTIDIKTGLPSKSLLNENLIFNLKNYTKNLIEVNLLDYNIMLPKEGAFVGVEFLNSFSNKKGISSLNIDYTENDSSNVYIRNLLTKLPWQNLNMEDFKKNLKIKKNLVPCLGLKVY